jgi:membrane associated rhomboid family serine protease
MSLVNGTNILILINTILYLITNNGLWSFVPKTFWNNMNTEAPKLLTSSFMHANISHLLFNMISLYVFGTVVERFLGTPTYLIFYLLACIIGNYIYAILNPNSTIMTLGASGAISAIVAIYFLLLKRNSSLLNVIYFEVLGLTFGQFSGINYMAHLIGLGIGALYYFLV